VVRLGLYRVRNWQPCAAWVSVLIGVSRKSFIGKILHQPNAADRLNGSLACAAIAVNNGAHIIRAHDVKETVEAVRMAERLRPMYFSAATE
jgi:dihydropteroate synthase